MLHTLMLYYIALRYDMIMLSHAPHIHVHECAWMCSCGGVWMSHSINDKTMVNIFILIDKRS